MTTPLQPVRIIEHVYNRAKAYLSRALPDARVYDYEPLIETLAKFEEAFAAHKETSAGAEDEKKIYHAWWMWRASTEEVRTTTEGATDSIFTLGITGIFSNGDTDEIRYFDRVIVEAVRAEFRKYGHAEWNDGSILADPLRCGEVRREKLWDLARVCRIDCEWPLTSIKQVFAT